MTRLVKRYGGTRLYDPVALSYTTAELLRALRARAVSVVVTDAATGEDVTHEVLRDN